MVVERFKNARAVYRRLGEKGRMLPEGLKYVESWTEANYARCFQLMECNDESLFHEWLIRWQDLVDFEIVRVYESEKAAKMIEAREE